MGLVVGDQVVEELLQLLGREGAKAFALGKGKFEHGAAQMIEQDEQVIRIDQGALGRLTEEIVGMMRQELVERIGGGDQNRQGGGSATARATGLLVDTGDRSGIPDQDGGTQAANVNPKFESVGGHDGAYAAIAEPLLDFASLGGQVSGTVAADCETQALPDLRAGDGSVRAG